jgi:transcriptional regulator with XRE-family HTH domain
MAQRNASHDPSRFGSRLRRLREERGWSISRLAQRSGVTQSYLSQIEGGKRQTPGMDTLISLARALETTLDDLTGFESPANVRLGSMMQPQYSALIHEVEKRTGRKALEAIEFVLRRFIEGENREGSLFGAHLGSVAIHEGVDLTEPVLDTIPDAETGREVRR